MSDTVTLTIDGQSVTVEKGATVWEAAQQLGIDIPVLCHSPRMDPVGVCRMCVVDIGARNMAASCIRPAEEGMQVDTRSPRVEQQRRMLIELLLSEYPEDSARDQTTGDDELLALARAYEVRRVRLPDGAQGGRPRGQDHSSPVIAVDHQACILCDKCVRGCNELQHNDVITRTGKGYTARIAFDLDDPMGESTCVSCGECMAVCPTGALTNRALNAVTLIHEDEPHA